ncbi:MAG TPA: HDOD domain-containing protein [Paucimonas sp.]|nr:HDOD domain-containing protein [Paucimonas sp.]
MYTWLRRLFSHPAPAAPARPVPAPAPEESAPAAAAPPCPPSKPSMLSALQRADVNGNFTNWLFDDRNEAESFTNPLENSILAALTDILNSKQSGANLVRRMPGVIPQLLQKLRSDDFSGAELARMISHDLVLVAGVVRLANSAFYNRNKPITSIEQAILVLGQTGLRQLITSVAFKPIIDLHSGHFTKMMAPRLWDQSEKCAIANRHLSEGAGIEPFDAFLAGLAQNVGLIVSLRVIDQMAGESDAVGSESFCNALIRCTHGLSCSIAREWRFPAAVPTAIEEAGSNKKFTELSPMGRILVVGDYLSKVDILIRQKRLNPDDARLVKGLSERETHCLQLLRELPDSPPIADLPPDQQQ